MKHKLILTIFLASSMISSANADANPQVLVETNLGSFELVLYPERASATVDNFLKLIESKFYDGLIFHRVIANFMVQTGGFDRNLKYYDSENTVTNESLNGLSNKTGSIAMARTEDPDSASSQFFINVRNNASLNSKRRRPGYTVFGKVTNGWEVIKRIENSKTAVKMGISEALPLEPIIILRARRL